MELNLEGLLLIFFFFFLLVVVVALAADTGFEAFPLAGWAAFASPGKGPGSQGGRPTKHSAPFSGPSGPPRDERHSLCKCSHCSWLAGVWAA